MAEPGKLHPDTIAVGYGYDPADGQGAAKPPLYLTSTFVYRSAEHAKETHRIFFGGATDGATPEPAYIYMRLGHPNLDMVEKRLAALDGAEASAGFCSGMAAISTLFMAHLKPGDAVLHGLPLYGGADGLLNRVMAGFGVRGFHFTDGLDAGAMREAAARTMAAGPVRLIWLESPANPTATVIDIGLAVQIAGEIAERQGFRPLVAVDNTFLGPLLQSPLACGADLCMTSLTKYCGGHSDLLAGGVSGSLELVAPLRALRTSLGTTMDPQTAWLLLRSLETLSVRTARVCDSALTIARYLKAHPKIDAVTFIGLAEPGSREHALMQRQTRGAGSTFSFRIQGGEAEAFRFLDALKLLRLAVSLGGSETLICHPASTTHYAVARDRLAEAGVTEATLRVSIGLEHPDDLIADLAQALAQGLMPDPSAIDGKLAPPEEYAQVLVIGAGPAGVAAAIEATKLGASVVLVDENPLDPQLIGLDVPLLFGGRMSGAVQRRGRLVEQLIAANPALEQAADLGVDVRLGVTAWGLYVDGPALRALPAPMVGLADEDRSWMCGFDRLILATGARDVALGFPGWDQPGVVGANGLAALLQRYDAFTGRRIVVLGSGELGVATALMAQARGLEVAAVVEVLRRAQASTVALTRLHATGIPILTGHTPKRAETGRDGVERLILSDVQGREVGLDCDTICVAFGLAPAIELLSAAGGRIVPDAKRGGHAPALQGWATSLPGVFTAGDSAGLARSEAEAADQGLQAARQALGAKSQGHPPAGPDAFAYHVAWFDALIQNADASTIICQCEAVTRGDLLDVRAPRYLGEPTEPAAKRGLGSLLADGPANQDQVKRLTRAGMGPCQGRRCREQIALTLAKASGVSPADIPLASYRAPVRPLPLKVMADWNETAEMTAGWEIWFAIPGQWSAYEDIGTTREFITPFGGEA